MPTQLPFALYDAFSTGSFGGATAGIVSEASGLSAETMLAMAQEVGAPATAFLQSVDPDLIDVRFFSTMTEYGMCGHGTVALATHLVDTGLLDWGDDGAIATVLRTSDGDAPLHLRRVDGRPLVMLDLEPASFETSGVDLDDLGRALGLTPAEFDETLPIENAIGDFVHLIAPVPSLEVMRKMTPDFSAIADLSRANGAQTVAVFTREVVDPESTLHCRDFCPAVGTPESPAAGTTNGALTAYLVRHGLIDPAPNQPTVVLSEQGYECGRPSQVRSEVTVTDGRIERLVVGGYARKSITGDIFVPPDGASSRLVGRAST